MRELFKRRLTSLLGVAAIAVGGMLFGAASPTTAGPNGEEPTCELLCYSTLQNDTEYVYQGGVVGFCVKARLEGETCVGDEKVRLAMVARPSFLYPVGHKTSKPGEWVTLCVVQKISYRACPGTYWAKFECKNESTGEVKMHNVKIVVKSHRHSSKGCGCGSGRGPTS